MSDSEKLSKTIAMYGIQNQKAMSQEEKVKNATKKVYVKIRKEYANLSFRHRSKIDKKEIIEKLREINVKYGETICNERSFIAPDGGLIEIYIEGKWRPVLSSEAKKQGTNDERMERGLSKQAQGNAIERLHKNYTEMSVICQNENIFPYICFLSGCDFAKNSSIPDRLTSLNAARAINNLYIYKEKEKVGKDGEKTNLRSLCSLFMREKEWSIKEIADILYKAAKIAIEYYLKEY